MARSLYRKLCTNLPGVSDMASNSLPRSIEESECVVVCTVCVYTYIWVFVPGPMDSLF